MSSNNKNKTKNQKKKTSNLQAAFRKKKLLNLKKKEILNVENESCKLFKKVSGSQDLKLQQAFKQNIKYPAALTVYSDVSDWQKYPASLNESPKKSPTKFDTNFLEAVVKPLPGNIEDEDQHNRRIIVACKGCKKRICSNKQMAHYENCRRTRSLYDINKKLSKQTIEAQNSRYLTPVEDSNEDKKISKDIKKEVEVKKATRQNKEEVKKSNKDIKEEIEKKKSNRLAKEDSELSLSSPVVEETKIRQIHNRTGNAIPTGTKVPAIAVTKANDVNDASSNAKDENSLFDPNSLIPEAPVVNAPRTRMSKKDLTEAKEKQKRTKKMKKAKPVKDKTTLDLDKQCGVLGPDGVPCMRLITCKAHTVVMKKAVFGRSKTYQELVALHQKNNAKIKAELLAQKADSASKEANSNNMDNFGDKLNNKRRRSFDESSDFDSDLECENILKAIRTNPPRPLATYSPPNYLKEYSLKRCQTMMQRDLYDQLHPPVLELGDLEQRKDNIPNNIPNNNISNIVPNNNIKSDNVPNIIPNNNIVNYGVNNFINVKNVMPLKPNPLILKQMQSHLMSFKR